MNNPPTPNQPQQPQPYYGPPQQGQWQAQPPSPPYGQNYPPLPTQPNRKGLFIGMGVGGAALLVVIILIVVFAGGSSPSSQVVGTWSWIKPTSVPGSADEQSQQYVESMLGPQTSPGCGLPGRIEFLSDGSFRADGMGVTGGKYELIEGGSRVRFTVMGIDRIINISVSGNHMTLDDDMESCGMQEYRKQ